MKETCHHIGIATNRPDELRKFYLGRLDFQELGTKEIGVELMGKIFGIQEKCFLTKLRKGRAIVEIFHGPRFASVEEEKTGCGLNHWSLEVPDKHAFVRGMEKAGVPLIIVKGKDKDIVFIQDPDGNRIEIYQGSEQA